MFPDKTRYFSQISNLYSVTNTTDKITIPIGGCDDLLLTPNNLLNYINIKYPQAQITVSEATQLYVVTIYDLCCKKVIGSQVNFSNVAEAPCGESLLDYVGTRWTVDFVCGKELVAKTNANSFELHALRTPLVDPLSGAAYGHIEESYLYIIGSDGYCKQRTGFLKSNTSLSKTPNTVSTQGVYLVFYTN